MKRLGIVVLVAALGGLAAVLPAPDPPPDPLAGLVIDRPGIESPVDASIWYCPWAQANAARDSFFGVASVTDADAEFTFPVAIPGEPPDIVSAQTSGPGAAIITLSDIAQRGDSPGFVEFSDGPAAAAVTVIGDVLTADTCVSSGPDEWFFAGGSTLAGEQLRLRLFNPFPETAKVTVTGFSEVGVEALGELRSISINPRSWRDISFEEMLRQRQALVISVRIDEGLVIPAMSFSQGADQAWWVGGELANEWEFPVASADGLGQGAIVVGNPNLTDVTVTVDFYTVTGPQRAAQEIVVPPETPIRIDLGAFASSATGVRLSATAPITAGVVGTGSAGTAVTGGATSQATAWLLPSLRSVGLNEGTLWLLNSGFEQISVTISELTGEAAVNSQVLIQPGTVVAVPIVEPDALGVLVESSDPFSAAWSIRGPSGIAFLRPPSLLSVSDAPVRLLAAGLAASAVAGVGIWGRVHERRRSQGSDLNLDGVFGSVLFFTDTACLRCGVVRARLDDLGVEYTEIAFNHEPDLQAAIGVLGVPQVVVRSNDGSIVARLAGAVSRRQLGRAVRKAS